ncbi:3257_t:CDS:2, partial [Entrophospora sp. SA101]
MEAPIPVIIHNFRGYDSHLICQSVAKSAGVHQICVIAETFGQYKTMKVGQIKYMDSYQFMNSSLSSLANNLGAIKLKHYKNYTKEQIAMVCQKGIYPYEYIDSLERFLKTELPPIEKFNTHFPIATHDKLKDLPPVIENIPVKHNWLNSFIFMTETEDIYKDMAERPDLFDLNNSKVIGLFKDEFPNNVIAKSYQIRSKLYHYVLADKTTKSKHKVFQRFNSSNVSISINDTATTKNTNTTDSKEDEAITSRSTESNIIPADVVS